jgi:hypothetical protein
MEPGIYYDLTFDQYKSIEAINKSSLDYLEWSPKHLYLKCLDPERKSDEPTPAMKLGSALHSMILEPVAFFDRYIVEPDNPPRRPTSAQRSAKKPSEETITAIEFWDNFDSAARGREILTTDQWEMCKKANLAVRAAPASKILLSTGKPEVTLVWRDLETEVLCKARVDWYKPGVVLDLKSTRSAAPADFGKQVAQLNWHVQAAFYLDGIRALTGQDHIFVFAALEKDEDHPHAAFYYANEMVVERGREIYRKRLGQYAECLKNNDWPGYPDELTELTFPAWALKEA